MASESGCQEIPLLSIWAYNGGDIFQSGGEIREQVQV